MEKNDAGPFAVIFLWIGLIAGGAAGAESGEFMPVLIGAIVLGGIGFWIGKQVDVFLARLIFVVVSIVGILINTAIRRFIFELIRAAVDG